jgi:VIT1/CCC1 family predicted Fe2+/Mn2+ transporter
MKELALVASIFATMIVGFVCGISYGENILKNH